MVIHDERIHAAHRRCRSEVHLQGLPVVAEGQRTARRGHRVHLQVPQLEADEGLTRHQRCIGDGGGRLDLLRGHVGHVDRDVVMQDVERVAARDDVVDERPVRSGHGRDRMLLVPEIVATILVGLGERGGHKGDAAGKKEGT